MSDPAIMLQWEVRGRTGTVAVCTVQVMPSRSCQVKVSMGEQEVVSETWPDVLAAQTRATQIRGELVTKGWLVTYSREESPPALPYHSHHAAASKRRDT